MVAVPPRINRPFARAGIVPAPAPGVSAILDTHQTPAAVNITLDELRTRLDELPRDRDIHVICRSGQRAYYATRILLQNGFSARNLSGGMLSRTILSGE